ncbi:hypothetical protein IB245_18955 [Pseudomonas sp. PDM02]|uniref:hypothetical protein n=1 Tax=Pseudomonas sp. PDM02 TaxID=2769267 RepID=UPI00178189D4|nr:hypothetical protein [Pseudomonas sp. PDM02]MBD9613582.1 hypothetical protein [Pseudomonas sp. PDM02]
MEAYTYSSRNNARRAGVAAGVASALIEITVHKNGDEVRFGWKEKRDPVPMMTTPTEAPKPKKEPAPKVQPEQRNGVKRPKEGGLCAAVWTWLDANPDASVKDAKAAAVDHKWNPNNVACEFYAWRKFNGITRRIGVTRMHA